MNTVLNEQKHMLSMSKAILADAPVLRNIAISAFTDDEQYKPSWAKTGGPPEHDSIQKHKEWMQIHDYIKCEKEGEIVAGCIVKHKGKHGEIFGLFVKSDSMRQGIGSHLLQYVLSTNPKIERWSLETPDYSTRNHTFYEHNGFILVEKTDVEAALGFGFYKYEQQSNHI